MVLGIDPGRSCGLALVEHRRGVRPRLSGAWHIRGGTRLLWTSRAAAAVDAVALSLPPTDLASLRIVLEVPGGRGASRRNYGPDTWLGLGRYAGVIEGLLYAELAVAALEMPSNDWPKRLRLRVGKQGAGSHRIQEACLICAGADEHLAAMPDNSKAARERRVCIAEAILIATAGGLK